MKYSFREWLALDEETQTALGNPTIYEELNQKIKDKKMVELEKMLRSADWWGFMSDDGREYKKWKAEEQKIKALRDLIGDDAEVLYKQYALKAGVVSEGTLTSKAKARPSEYEKHMKKVMKTYGITSIEQLEDDENGNEALKRFWKEVDDTWKGNDELEVNKPKSKNEGLFAEMSNVDGRGTLDYAVRQVGDKSLTASSFCDAGNLYENTPTWQPPSPQRKRGWADK